MRATLTHLTTRKALGVVELPDGVDVPELVRAMRSNQLVVHPDLPPREKHPPDWTKPPEGAAAAGPTTALPGDPAGMVGEAPVVAGARGATAPGRKAGVR